LQKQANVYQRLILRKNKHILPY